MNISGGNRGDRFSVKQLEKTKKSLETKLEKLNDQARKEDGVTFEELEMCIRDRISPNHPLDDKIMSYYNSMAASVQKGYRK